MSRSPSTPRTARRRALAAGLVVICLWFAHGQRVALAAQHGEADSEEIRAVNEAFVAWQFDEARAKLATLALAYPADPWVNYLRGELAFYEGRYPAAVDLLDQAIANADDDHKGRFAALRNLVADTAEVTKNHVTATSADGRFAITYPEGKDEVLVAIAFEAMEDATGAFAEDFGVIPSYPIRIEVYDSAADLARVSPLTEEDIVTSGTIALCKYNRLMLTSPKALIRGYGWVDTLVHEYAHMVINIAGKGRIPIWLHEGLAKYSERRWRGGDAERRLPAYSEWLLYKRAKEGKIVTFDEMHPSMAKLPSQEDAAMAFAEVYAAMEALHQTFGPETLAKLVAEVGSGAEVEDAIATVTGASFAQFLRTWKAHMVDRTRRYEGAEPPDVFEQIAFRKDASVDAEETKDMELIKEESAREWVHLGDMLYTKGRAKAAAVEYRKAVGVIGVGNPVLQTRLGRALLDSGNIALAVEAMQSAIDDGETYVTLYVYLGEALVRAGKWQDASAALGEAAALNPFDPSVHRLRAAVYRHTGALEKAEESERLSRIAGGKQASETHD